MRGFWTPGRVATYLAVALLACCAVVIINRCVGDWIAALPW